MTGNIKTESFELSSCDGSTIRCEVDRPALPIKGRCILVPPFGLSMLDLIAPAYYLLCNGFEVVRIDPTCHVGLSDGDIRNFTIGRLTSDIRAVVASEADDRTSVISISLSSRAIFRALADFPVRGIFLLSPVVNMRQTLIEVAGEDPIGLYLGNDRRETYSILGFDISRDFCKDGLEGGFCDIEGTLSDAARIAAPTYFIFGSQDRWVSYQEVEQVAAAMPQSHLVGIQGGNHQMFRSPMMLKSYLAALLREMFSLYGVDGVPFIPPFRDVIKFVQNRKETLAAA